MVRGTELSPDGQQLLVTVTEPPFSVRAAVALTKQALGWLADALGGLGWLGQYQVPYGRFAKSVQVWDWKVRGGRAGYAPSRFFTTRIGSLRRSRSSAK
jgi:hypothetical protein